MYDLQYIETTDYINNEENLLIESIDLNFPILLRYNNLTITKFNKCIEIKKKFKYIKTKINKLNKLNNSNNINNLNNINKLNNINNSNKFYISEINPNFLLLNIFIDYIYYLNTKKIKFLIFKYIYINIYKNILLFDYKFNNIHFSKIKNIIKHTLYNINTTNKYINIELIFQNNKFYIYNIITNTDLYINKKNIFNTIKNNNNNNYLINNFNYNITIIKNINLINEKILKILKINEKIPKLYFNKTYIYDFLKYKKICHSINKNIIINTPNNCIDNFNTKILNILINNNINEKIIECFNYIHLFFYNNTVLRLYGLNTNIYINNKIYFNNFNINNYSNIIKINKYDDLYIKSDNYFYISLSNGVSKNIYNDIIIKKQNKQFKLLNNINYLKKIYNNNNVIYNIKYVLNNNLNTNNNNNNLNTNNNNLNTNNNNLNTNNNNLIKDLIDNINFKNFIFDYKIYNNNNKYLIFNNIYKNTKKYNIKTYYTNKKYPIGSIIYYNNKIIIINNTNFYYINGIYIGFIIYTDIWKLNDIMNINKYNFNKVSIQESFDLIKYNLNLFNNYNCKIYNNILNKINNIHNILLHTKNNIYFVNNQYIIFNKNIIDNLNNNNNNLNILLYGYYKNKLNIFGNNFYLMDIFNNDFNNIITNNNNITNNNSITNNNKQIILDFIEIPLYIINNNFKNINYCIIYEIYKNRYLLFGSNNMKYVIIDNVLYYNNKKIAITIKYNFNLFSVIKFNITQLDNYKLILYNYKNNNYVLNINSKKININYLIQKFNY